jgi:hypothetical protein
MSAPRQAAVRGFLSELRGWIAPRRLEDATVQDVSGFLDAKLRVGFHPNTVRKWLNMAKTY